MVSYGVIGWHVASWGVPRESERERGARDGGVSRARATVSLPREHDEIRTRATPPPHASSAHRDEICVRAPRRIPQDQSTLWRHRVSYGVIEREGQYGAIGCRVEFHMTCQPEAAAAHRVSSQRRCATESHDAP